MNEEVAIKEGAYYIGKPCVKCGGCLRYVSSRRCVLCVKESYKRNLDCRKDSAKKRIEKIKEENKDKGLYFEGNTCANCNTRSRYVSNGQCVLCQKERQKQHRQKIKETHKGGGLYFEGKPCKNCGSCMRYASTVRCVLCNKEYRTNSKEQKAKYDKQYDKNNPEKTKAKGQKRRARKLNAEGSFTAQEWLELCKKYGNKCIVPGCENTDLHADHIVPLSQGGSNWITNIQPLCKSHNCSKGTKIIDYR